MFLLVLLAVIIAVLWIVAMVDRAALDEIRSRIDRELAAMEAVERLFEARDRARQEPGPPVARVGNALLLLLGVALGLRLATWLVMPAIPLLVVLFGLVAVYRLLFIRRR